MIRISKKIGAVNVTAICHNTQDVLAEGILATIRSIALNEPLMAGTKLRFGWTVFTLEKDKNDELIVSEPDYDRDPLRFTRPDISVSLDVLANQTKLMRLINIEPLDVGFEQLVVIEKEIMQSASILVTRIASDNANDSGWSISRPDKILDEENEDSYEVCRVYELLRLMPEVLSVLALPAGYMALIESKLITKIFNQQGEELLHNVQF